MSIAFSDTSPRNSFVGTGATSYEWLFLAADEIEADQKRTHIVSAIDDPVLRDVLDDFHDVLLHKLTSPMTRFSSLHEQQLISPWGELRQPYVLQPDPSWYQPQQISPSYASPVIPSWYQPTVFYTFNNTAISASQGVWPYWATPSHANVLAGVMPTSYSLVSTNALTAGPLSGFDALGVAAVTSAPSEHFYDTNTFDIQELRNPVRNPKPLAVTAVEDIANWLGVPAVDIFGATGIAKRTYQEWKTGGIRRPRPSSEGRLWELHSLAAELIETMGHAGVRSWFRQDPSRRALLRSGAIDQLASQAYTALASTDARPPWVGVGSWEEHVAPRREVTLDQMDPRDVVEPEQ
jgi:hypothetical protein